jgi:hypothetical protein
MVEGETKSRIIFAGKRRSFLLLSASPVPDPNPTRTLPNRDYDLCISNCTIGRYRTRDIVDRYGIDIIPCRQLGLFNFS